MKVTTISSREFNQDTGGAKRAAASGPVYITDRGRPAHVLLSFEAYERLLGGKETIVSLLSRTEGAADAELCIPDRDDVARAVEFD